MSVGFNDAFRDEVGREGASVTYVTAATTLLPGSKVVKATIPAAVANAYAITLPLPHECPHGSVIEIEFTQAAQYSDGTVTVVANGTTYTVVATADRLRFLFTNRHSVTPIDITYNPAQ